ncbi:MAG TPA: hypothetical protein VEB64_07170 [Azospirillaceae bacterium]|nr:hypothetical protein [Azospirillaceae bacterium]
MVDDFFSAIATNIADEAGDCLSAFLNSDEGSQRVNRLFQEAVRDAGRCEAGMMADPALVSRPIIG